MVFFSFLFNSKWINYQKNKKCLRLNPLTRLIIILSCFLVHLIRRPLAFDKFILALCLLLPRIKLAPTATLTCFEPSPFYAHFAHTLLKVSLHVMFLRVSRSVFILPTLQANIKTLALNDTVIIIVYAYPIQI